MPEELKCFIKGQYQFGLLIKQCRGVKGIGAYNSSGQWPLVSILHVT